MRRSRKKIQREPDFDLVIKIRNNHMTAWRERLKFSPGQAAEYCGVSYPAWNQLEYCRKKPYHKNKSGDIRLNQNAVKIAEAMGFLFDEIWPDAVLRVQRNFLRVQMDAPERLLESGALPPLLPSPEDMVETREREFQVRQAIGSLTPIQQRRICQVFGIDTERQGILEIAEDERVDERNVRSVISRGLRVLGYGDGVGRQLKVLYRDLGN
jgi:hypothetical protein